MPRLRPSLINRAATESKYLPALLIECRDLPSARNELRWLIEHVTNDGTHKHSHSRRSRHRATQRDTFLSNLVRRRSKGEPLQYILGNQPFGNLEILCRPNVLIPRPETELYTTGVASCLHDFRGNQTRLDRGGLRILDLCTGSGCIALLLHSLLRSKAKDSTFDLQIAGLDVSQDALCLAQQNKTHNLLNQSLTPGADREIFFNFANVLDLVETYSTELIKPDASEVRRSARIEGSTTRKLLSNIVEPPPWRQDGSWDVVISNPPYISQSDYAPGGTTTRSVRKFEPKLALVPSTASGQSDIHGDTFYKHIIQIGRHVGARLIVMEVGDSGQAWRVRDLARDLLKDDREHFAIELWRDDGSVETVMDVRATLQEREIMDRAVVIWREKWATWRQSSRLLTRRETQDSGEE